MTVFYVPYSLDSETDFASSFKSLSSGLEDELPVRILHWGNVKRFRGGLVFKADRRVYHSSLGSRVIKKKKKKRG